VKAEFEWIALWKRVQRLPKDVRIGIGDDCAVVETGKRGLLGLLKCDACVEGIHFTRKAPLDLVGRKVMARNISDIAAMGGRPRFALVSVAIPDRIKDAGRRKLHRGLTAAARAHGCEIIGGDTSRSRSGLFVSVFLYGEVEKKNLLTRSGAKKGDHVYVTGKLGGSIKGKHLSFKPRLEEARWLAHHFKPTACIDLSDGLGGDLRRLAEQSKVGFEIFAASILRSPGCSVQQALYDGEDYELLFSVRPSASGTLTRSWKRKFKVPLTWIGIVRPSSFGLVLTEPFGRRSQIHPSYDHFRHHS
jgi:thiamine-monophosphate kinase